MARRNRAGCVSDTALCPCYRKPGGMKGSCGSEDTDAASRYIIDLLMHISCIGKCTPSYLISEAQ